jgi:hypothetical protein
MYDLPSNLIVRRGLALAERHPDWASLQILDAALDGQCGSHPDFEVQADEAGAGEWADWLDPPSPFARLLFNAYGSPLAPAEFDAESPHWQDVIAAFGEHFRLWR